MKTKTQNSESGQGLLEFVVILAAVAVIALLVIGCLPHGGVMDGGNVSNTVWQWLLGTFGN